MVSSYNVREWLKNDITRSSSVGWVRQRFPTASNFSDYAVAACFSDFYFSGEQGKDDFDETRVMTECLEDLGRYEEEWNTLSDEDKKYQDPKWETRT